MPTDPEGHPFLSCTESIQGSRFHAKAYRSVGDRENLFVRLIESIFDARPSRQIFLCDRRMQISGAVLSLIEADDVSVSDMAKKSISPTG